MSLLPACTAYSNVDHHRLRVVNEDSSWCRASDCGGEKTAEYHDSLCGFSMRYPERSKIFRDDAHQVRIELPVRPGTNLIEKYVDVSCRADVGSCDDGSLHSGAMGTRFREINGVVYRVQQGEDVAAGSLYEWTRYSAERNGRCLAVTFVLHSGHPENYSPPVAAYDSKQESALFGDMVRSFRVDHSDWQ